MNKNKKILFVIAVVILLIISTIGLFIFSEETPEIEKIALVNTTSEIIEIEEDTFKVDIKGAVQKPGVYLVSKGAIIQDLIDLAGGLTKNAYTKNINLSKELTKEMVIYVYTNSEIKKLETVDDSRCITQVIEITNGGDVASTTKTTSTNNVNSLININTASLAELMNINGIGESKAKAIIEYRNSNKFNSIEDIMNVSGIGESLFVKIKEYITV